jgi:hypothetical protein
LLTSSCCHVLPGDVVSHEASVRCVRAGLVWVCACAGGSPVAAFCSISTTEVCYHPVCEAHACRFLPTSSKCPVLGTSMVVHGGAYQGGKGVGVHMCSEAFRAAFCSIKRPEVSTATLSVGCACTPFLPASCACVLVWCGVWYLPVQCCVSECVWPACVIP